MESGGFQRGLRDPGVLICAAVLLGEDPDFITHEEIRSAMSCAF